MNIRMLACEPCREPQERMLPEAVEAVTAFINGWFEVIGLGEQLLLYCHEHPKDIPFNRMVRGRPVFGNFLISKLGTDGKRSDLSDQEIASLVSELIVPTRNDTN